MPTPNANARPKSVIYRVTGLPCRPSEDEVASFLRKAIENELLEEEGLEKGALVEMMKNLKKIDIILPHDDSMEKSHALLEWKPSSFPGFLSFLNKNPSSSYEIEYEGREISFDRNFLGFTQLYGIKATTPITADIIALTGLDSHAYGSFRGKGNLGRMWLRDFLSKDLPNCRCLIYGYDSKLSSHGIETIMDYHRGLLEEIKKVRKTKEELCRPLFFIAHSFGGIIVAHTICKSSMINDSEDIATASLYKATYGVLFFGTPHKGLAIENIRMMLEGNTQHPRNELLDEIKEKSKPLISQLSDFKNVLRGRKVVSFFEQSQTQSLEANQQATSGFSRTGEYTTVVETDSALLQLPDTMEIKVPLQLDHSQLVKYDNKDARGYTSALHYLKEFERDAPAIVRTRFLQKSFSLVPSSNVPYPKDSDFIGRRDILEKVEARLISTGCHSRVALVGLGGMGKSQIAIEFSYIAREKSEDTWVFWVYANTAARFEQSYRDIAEKLELDGRHDPKFDILQLVSRWLTDERNGRWLLIIDNADDAWIFSPPNTHASTAIPSSESRKNLLAYIPNSSTGAVLVTSRNKDSAHRIVGNQANNLIDVYAMTEHEALDLLNTKLPESQSLDESEKLLLLEELHNIPLAITQAAAYIMKGSPRMTVSKYLDLFKENDKNRTSLLDQGAGDLRRDPEVPNAVITTWQISFDQIRRNNLSAAELLSLMSVLHRQGIPESLLRIQIIDKISFEDAIALLIGFSLIATHSGSEAFDMHRLVQLATRKWLAEHNRIDEWSQTALQCVRKKFPIGKYENWKVCESLLPHVETVLSYSFETKEDLLLKADILYNLSWYFDAKGNRAASKANIAQALEIQEQYLPNDHANLLTTLRSYADALTQNGKYDAAEPILRRVLVSHEKVFGKEHLDTLISMNNLATLLNDQRKYEEAEVMHRQTLTIGERVLGKEHPRTLISMNNLACSLDNQGRFGEAEIMYRQTLELKEKVLGTNHPATLRSMNNFAWVLMKRGNYEDAETVFRQTLELREKVLGTNHPDTLLSMECLASVLESRGNYEAAEVISRQTLELREKVLGVNHPDTRFSMNNLASVLNYRRKYEDVEAMF